MDIAEAREFLCKHHRGVLATYRKDGNLQISPVTPGVDDEGRVIISSRETAFKTKNIRRNPKVSLCAFHDAFHGSVWVQVNGSAEIVSQPEAMELLLDFQRRVKGDTDWEEYRKRMERERRVLIRVKMESVGPNRRG